MLLPFRHLSVMYFSDTHAAGSNNVQPVDTAAVLAEAMENDAFKSAFF